MKYLFASLLVVLLISSGCDPEKIFGEKKPPEVGEIQSDDADLIVMPLDTVRFWVQATDPENGTLSYDWSKSGGQFLGSVTGSEVTWVAPAVGGSFKISVKVSNAEKDVTKETRITVQSPFAPFVRITDPADGFFAVQWENVPVKFQASHANGIAAVELHIRDTLVQTFAGHPGSDYEITWPVNQDAGPAELKIVAIANVTSAAGADSVQVTIEGLVPGKTEMETIREY